MRILDTHLHLVYLDRFSYPWLGAEPHLNRQFSAEDYFAEAERLGIEAALHMEVDVAESDIEAETAFVTGVHPKVVGAIAACRPEYPGFEGFLQRMADNASVRGLRRILHNGTGEIAETALFVNNLRLLPRYNLSFDLCLRADQLPLGEALARKCPDVQFVLDHCGVPRVAARELDPWRAYITALARCPNVVAKISGIVAYASADWTVEDLRPYVEHVIAAFGWDRVVWGSDHPVCTARATLTQWVEATRALIAGASADEQARLLHRNAERVYRV